MKRIKSVKEFRRSFLFIKTGISHDFETGVGRVQFKSPISNKEASNLRIVSDRDIYYNGSVIFKKGQFIPWFHPIDKWTLFPDSEKFDIVLDFRTFNHIHGIEDFEQDLLTDSFIINLVK